MLGAGRTRRSISRGLAGSLRSEKIGTHTSTAAAAAAVKPVWRRRRHGSAFVGRPAKIHTIHALLQSAG